MKTLRFWEATLVASALAIAAYAAVPGLADSNWQIEKLDGKPLRSGKGILRFDDNRISATVGCNGIGGQWKMQGKRLTGGPYMSTMMYCDGVMDQEHALGQLLDEKPEVTIKGNQLILASKNHRAELRKVDRALAK